MVLGKMRNQRGAGAIGCLFLVAIIAAGMYVGFQLGIPRLRHSSFEDRLTESFGNLRQLPAADLQKQIIQIATDFDIALTPAQVKIDKTGGRLKIDVTYEKVIDLKIWRQTIPFRLIRNPAP